MNNFRNRLKKKAIKQNVRVEAAIDTFIQPFKEMPSVNNPGKESGDRINAHALFSFYTADVMKEDIVYAR